jgi:hypothetical protein
LTSAEAPHVLYVFSPIGLGHAQRDVAIARELRRLIPEVEIDWLAQDPVTRVFEGEGERIHPMSRHLAISRSTVFYWVRDLPLGRARRASDGQRKGNHAMSRHYRLLREQAYEEGRATFDLLAIEPTFREFVCMYIGEGSKRSRSSVAICNSDPCVVQLGAAWITELTRNKVGYSLQYHGDQQLDELVAFWAGRLDIGADEVKLLRKSNSNRLNGRSWRSKHGVLTVRVGARLQAWMDRVREDWIDSADGA